MIQLDINNKRYKLPLKNGVLTGSCTLDENWRSMDYKNTDSLLGFSVTLIYEVPMEYTDALFDVGIVSLKSDDLEENERNLIQLNFDIIHTDYDPNSGKMHIHEGFPRFPEPSFLQGYQFSEQTLTVSKVWFPGFGVPTNFSQIRFGSLKAQSTIGFHCEGSVKDTVAELNFTIEEELPLQYDFLIKGYANQFVGFSEEQIINEIEDCFANLYKREDFNADIKVTDATHGGVRISYSLKG